MTPDLLLRTAPVALALLPLAAAPAAAHGQAPERTLAPAVGFEAASFTRIRGLVERPDGTLIVVDQTENAVWHVDPARGTRTRLGRSGAGPGEYDGPTGVGPWSGDSVLVSDLGNGRLVVVGPDLSAARTIPMFAPGRSLPRATDARGGMYFDGSVAVRMARRTDRTASDRAPLVRWDDATGRADTVSHIRIPGEVNPGPFPDWDVWAAGADGTVVVVRNQGEYRVDRVRPDGTEVRGAVVDEVRPRVTAEDRRLWQERNPRGGARVSMGGGAAQRAPPAEVAFPDRFPFARLNGVWVDAEGRAWVERHQAMAETRPLLDVFDGASRRVARVRLPAGRQVVGFGPGGLWAVRVDEVDLQWLERYDLSDLDGREDR